MDKINPALNIIFFPSFLNIGKMHGRAEYFDRGSWNKVDDPVLDDFRLSGTCVAGSTELDAGYLIGNEVYILGHIWQNMP